MAQRKIRALHVAEKPSVAKSLAMTLSNNRQTARRGPSQYNPLYDFETGGPPGPHAGRRFQHAVT